MAPAPPSFLHMSVTGQRFREAPARKESGNSQDLGPNPSSTGFMHQATGGRMLKATWVALTLVSTWQTYQGHSPLNHTLVLGHSQLDQTQRHLCPHRHSQKSGHQTATGSKAQHHPLLFLLETSQSRQSPLISMFMLLPFILHGLQKGDTRASSPEGMSATGDCSHQPHPLDPGNVTPSRGHNGSVPKALSQWRCWRGKNFRNFLPQYPATRAQARGCPSPK